MGKLKWEKPVLVDFKVVDSLECASCRDGHSVNAECGVGMSANGDCKVGNSARPHCNFGMGVSR